MLIGGFSGSGKTTLIRKLVEHLGKQGQKVAVIANETGEIGIDGDTISEGEVETREITSDCVYCPMEMVWKDISDVAKKTGTVSSGDTDCAQANTAMFIAGGLLDKNLAHTTAIVARAISAARSLCAYEAGAVGPGKDCGYENSIIKAISGVPIAQEGKTSTCAHSDLMMENGLPQLSNMGAVVGGWQTRVKAIRMETSATGGDSHIWVKGDRTYIGPRRVIPLCRASVIYPGLREKLKSNRVAKGYLCESIQVTKFYVRTDFRPIELKAGEREIYRHIGKEPVSFGDLLIALKKRPSPSILDSLVQKRLIQAIGFTPTDALHGQRKPVCFKRRNKAY